MEDWNPQSVADANTDPGPDQQTDKALSVAGPADSMMLSRSDFGREATLKHVDGDTDANLRVTFEALDAFHSWLLDEQVQLGDAPTTSVSVRYACHSPGADAPRHRLATVHGATSEALIVTLLPAWTSPNWFHDNVTEAEYLCLLDDRLDFGDTGNSAPFASMLAVFDGAGDGEESNIPTDLLAVLERRGTVYEVSDDTPTVSGEQVGFEAFGSATPERSSAGFPLSAPRASGGRVLSDLAVGDELHLMLDDGTMGFPSDVKADVCVRVLTVEPDDEDDPGYYEVLTVGEAPEHASREETYYLIAFDPERPEDVVVSVADSAETRAGMWQDVRVEAVEQVSAANTTSAYQHVA